MAAPGRRVVVVPAFRPALWSSVFASFFAGAAAPAVATSFLAFSTSAGLITVASSISSSTRSHCGFRMPNRVASRVAAMYA